MEKIKIKIKIRKNYLFLYLKIKLAKKKPLKLDFLSPLLILQQKFLVMPSINHLRCNSYVDPLHLRTPNSLNLSFLIKTPFVFHHYCHTCHCHYYSCLMPFFFFVTRGVRASLRAAQLILGPTKHPASSVDR